MKRLLLWTSLAVVAMGCAAEAPKTAEAPSTSAVAAPTEIQIAVTDAGFEPANVTVAKGEPVTLVFTRKVEHTCANEAVFPALAQNYPLPLNQPVRVEIAGGVQDTLTYACPMNMFGGTITAK